MTVAVERKLATVLFVDLVDSTALVSSSDPEVVRRRVTRFFEKVSHCIQTHGGTVEKFAGDAVMAAFGIPRAHEDDAERAVRAAFGMLDSIAELGLQARIGIESGEVVAEKGDSTFATGEAVNIAARLQQAAAPGQILIGPHAYRLSLGCLEVEDVGPLEVRGRTEPVWAWRAVAAVDGIVQRRAEAPLVGRDVELELLENTYSRAVRSRRAHLVTIFGEPGVGKSRLAREFTEALEGATVLSGRCLPYGEGITYWALAEMVKTAAGITDDDPVRDAFAKLCAACEDEAVADLLALASGVLEAVAGERSPQEIAWAAREWAEKLAEPQPLVLVFEDIHWAEEPLLELIQQLAERVRDQPLLIVCLARPELLDVKPDWGGGALRATAIELEALAAEESEELLDALLESRPLPGVQRDALLEKTEGNPLFLEETIRMLVEQGGNGGGAIGGGIPDTLQALIAARIDALPPRAKTVLQRGAVVGRIFWADAVRHLAPDLDPLDDALDDLLLREFVLREQRSSISGEPAYRFKHVLIRDVAYGGLSKSVRAEQHARFADWLRERAGEELLEFRAYHLDQACLLHAELDGSPPAELAAEAAEALELSGRRALAREAYAVARNHLLRAAELDPTLERRWLAARAAFRIGDWAAVASEMEAVRVAAADAGEAKIHGRALTALAEVALYQQADVPRARELVEEALEVLADVDHAEARFEALSARAAVANWTGDFGAVEEALRQALAVAREADRKDLETVVVESLAFTYLVQLEVEKAAPLVERARDLAAESGSVLARAHALQTLGMYHQIRDEYDEARTAYVEARALNDEIGHTIGSASALRSLGRLAQRERDYESAERYFREALKLLKAMRDRGFLCEVQRMLAQVLVAQRRLEEAERLALEARETVGREDRVSQITTSMALGIVRAAQGRDEEAERLLRGAVDAIAATPFRSSEPEVLRELIAFLRERGRDEEAGPYERRLLELAPAATLATAFAQSLE